MLKTISAALIAASVLVAAPAMAAGYGRTPHAPAIETMHLNSSVLNANARWGRHHHRHFHHRHHHHRFHHYHHRFHGHH